MMLAISACAPMQPAPRLAPLERYMPYVGEPVDSFVAFRFDGWEVLSDDKLILWTNPSQAYLITVQTPCSNLEFTERLRVTQTGSTVSHFEQIEFRDRSSRMLSRCPIMEIRPLDIRRYHQDLKRRNGVPPTSTTPPPANVPGAASVA
jgi:hypothetical protein